MCIMHKQKSIGVVLLIFAIIFNMACTQRNAKIITSYGAIADGKTNNTAYWNNDGIDITDCNYAFKFTPLIILLIAGLRTVNG